MSSLPEHSGREVWFCRHGNRIDFVDPNWKGFNPPLSPDGVEQARETAARLKRERIEHIFASPFLRTIQTGHLIAEALKLPLRVEFGVCEWLNPEWFTEFPPFPPLESLLGEFPMLDTSYESLVMPEYPESWDACMNRCRRAVRALLEKFEGNILIVGHGATAEGGARGLCTFEEQLSAGLCSLTLLREGENGFALALNGDTSHLSTGTLAADRMV